MAKQKRKSKKEQITNPFYGMPLELMLKLTFEAGKMLKKKSKKSVRKN